MADVIPFAPRRRFASQASPAEGPFGQILFFTGVRYERQHEPAASKPPRRPPRRPQRAREPAPASGVNAVRS